MERIQKISSYFVWLFTLLLVIKPLMNIGIWFILDIGYIKNLISQGVFGMTIGSSPYHLNLNTSTWTGPMWALALGSSIVELIPQLLTLASLRMIFKNYQKGEIFTTSNARHYGYIGAYFFLAAFIIKPLSYSLLVLAATWSSSPGGRVLTIVFGNHNMEDLFYGMLVIIISWIMKEASKLQAEQNLVI